MQQYLDMLRYILENGEEKSDRTGTGTISVFGYQMRFNLQEGFPLVTTKKVHMKSVIEELLWFLRGETNTKSLKERGVSIWDEWADENGELGPVYGYQWRSWPTPNGEKIDQLKDTLEQIKINPYSRRHIISAWNVADLEKMALQPCHILFQFNCEEMDVVERAHYAVDNRLMHRNEIIFDELMPDYKGRTLEEQLDENNIPKGYLDCHLYQRSADMFLGVPFNIASYSLLTMMVAQETERVPRDFIHSFGDFHIYKNHIEQVREQLTREPRPLPKLIIPKGSVDEIAYHCTHEDFILEGYDPHPAIKGKVSK